MVEENRVLKEQMNGRQLRLTDEQRRRLAAKAKRLGRKVLNQVATIVVRRRALPPASVDFTVGWVRIPRPFPRLLWISSTLRLRFAEQLEGRAPRKC